MITPAAVCRIVHSKDQGKDGDRRTSKKVPKIKQAREAGSMEGCGGGGAGEKQVDSGASPMCPLYEDGANGIR